MKTAKGVLLLMGALFLVLGLIFMGVSFGVKSSLQMLMDSGISTEGEFISVGENNTRIRYTVDGQSHMIRSSIYSMDMRVGDPVTVWYQSGSPENGRMDHWAVWGIWLILGSIFSAVGVGFLAAMIPKILRKRSLMLNGMPVTAQVTEIVQNHYVRINSVSPYVIRAVCIHPYTGQEMKVKSEYLMENPQPHIRNNEVEVLVDPMRDDRYYMMVDKPGHSE